MSTRSTTHFISGARKDEHAEAIIYRHSDGYPEGHGRDLQRFFADVEAQTQDTRFGDPSYLAAKLVVWLAREFAVGHRFTDAGQYVRESHADTRPLDFLSVGVCQSDPGDVEYIYVIDCGAQDESGHPIVVCHEASEDAEGKVILGAVVPIPAEVPA